VCKLTRRSPNTVARHRFSDLKPQDNTPASQCLPSRRALLASEGYRRTCTPPKEEEEGGGGGGEGEELYLRLETREEEEEQQQQEEGLYLH